MLLRNWTTSASSPGCSHRRPDGHALRAAHGVSRRSLTQTAGFEQGAAILAGPRVGPDTIDLILCIGRTANITTTGQHITNHTSTTSIRPGLRRAVLARDDGCTIDGCSSTYRLEVHHILERSKGGDNSAENLTTLCWWHHHVAVHRQGMRIDPQSPPRRRRLLHPRANCGYQSPAPTPTPSPYSAPSTHAPTEPLPDQDRRPPRRVNGLADQRLRRSLRDHGTDQASPRRSLPGV